MNQDIRFTSTPHHLPRRHSLSAGATASQRSLGTSSFEELMQQQLKTVAGVGKLQIKCDPCQDTGWLSVYCSEAGKDLIPCDFCGGKGDVR